MTPPDDPTWFLVEKGFVVQREHEIESLFAIANGHLGTRASLAEGSRLSAPATFVAGVYEVLEGYTIPALVVLPDWTRLEATVEGHPLRVDEGTILAHRRVLDLCHGVLWRFWRHRDGSGRITRVEGLRLASQADRRVLLQVVALTPENYGGRVTVRWDAGDRELRTTRGVTVSLRSRAFLDGTPVDGVDAHVEVGRTYRLERVVEVRTSRDPNHPVATEAPDAVIRAHIDAWAERWRDCDLRIEGDDAAQRALRFAIYHLVSAVDPDDGEVSVGARALTGGTYMGHVFWDTELFVLPFLTWTWPRAARSVLLYRHHTLPAARARAAAHGYRGALYAWESADTGEDVTPRAVIAPDGEVLPIRVGEQEQHISADVAHAVWAYWRTTGDDAFLRDAGAEILFEAARFHASRVEPGDDGLWHIRGVIGPDEYHETVDDNAYTNVMGQHCLDRAAEVAAWLRDRHPEHWRALADRLDLGDDEVRAWPDVAARIYTGFDPETGLFEQFRGFFDLDDVDLAAHTPRAVPLDVLLGREVVQRAQILKQADVVMLMHVLWDRFPPAVREANFRYYEPRTGHGSSLSPAIHAAVAARLGDVALARRYFDQAVAIDLSNTMGNAAGGVHIGALGGLWQAAALGFGGLAVTEAGPVLCPALPPGWRRLALTVRWQGQPHSLEARCPAS